MSSHMKRDFLVYSGSQYPSFYGFIRTGRRVYIREYVVVRVSTVPHEFCRLLRYVKVFLTSCFLLPEDYPGKVALLVYLSPCKFEYIASS